tara:strand:- start:1173 stop:3140 length:1968 start_codon:yes stop_codon:yes gene_type:complete
MTPSILKRAPLLFSLLIFPALADFNSVALSAGDDVNGKLDQQRSDFKTAERALKKHQTDAYLQLLPSLTDYPLAPYLIYQELSQRLRSLPYKDVDKFLRLHADSYLGDRLLKNWLSTLARKKLWQQYQTYYQHHIKDITLQCYQLRARLYNGDTKALEDIAPVWNVGTSRPKACDPLFKQWMDAGLLTDDIAWDRHAKALAARKPSLAGYIGKNFNSKELAAAAKKYRAVYSRPSLIFYTDRYSQKSPENKEIILFGLKHVAKRQPVKTLSAWTQYNAQQEFSESEQIDMQELLAVMMVRSGNMQQAEDLLEGKAISSEQLVERLIRVSLRERDWDKIYFWLNKLPQEAEQSERWRYWRARSLHELDPKGNAKEVKGIYSDLALRRDFYGFLSADILGQKYELVDRPVTPPAELMSLVIQSPGILRAREFLALNRINSARREWRHTTRDFSVDEKKAAGLVAQQWGWHRKGIEAMASARYWDDLQVRFPLAFNTQVQAVAEFTKIEPQLLFAVARQESAFSPDARSRVGATGLMQLMPGTAKDTARKIGITYKKSDLLRPDINVKLGGSYLKQMMGRFEDNRILTAAAYNAGPHRVSKWLSDDDQLLPYDVWIELIPFKETRRYVQNILTYSVIYGYRMGAEVPLIRQNEARQML